MTAFMRIMFRVMCWLGEHDDGQPYKLHWHRMTCIHCGKEFEL